MLTRESTSDAINRVGSGAAGDFPNGEAGSPVSGTSAGPSRELDDLRAKARERDQFLDLLLRTRADFENYQKRARREREEERRYQPGPVFLDLLPVLDDVEKGADGKCRRAGVAQRAVSRPGGDRGGARRRLPHYRTLKPCGLLEMPL